MSIKLMTYVFDSDLPTTEKFVLLAMADYASDNGDSIFPSIETLSKKTSLSDRSVQNSIKSLIEKKYLVLLKKGGGRSYTNLYKIRCSKFTLYEKGETGTKKGETGTKKGEPRSPDPSLTIIDPSLTNKDPLITEENLSETIYEDCTPDDEPINDKKKPKPKHDTKNLYSIAEALAEVTGMSLPANKSRIFAEAKLIIKDERITPEIIRRDFSRGGAWYRYDWRGKKGQKPILTQIRETILTFPCYEEESSEFRADEFLANGY
jgi:hypothetical protein